MIKKILFLFFFVSSVSLFAQEVEGELINEKGEKKSIFFVRPYSKQNYKHLLFLRFGMQQELYAKYHRRANLTNQVVYVSILPKDQKDKVWSQLHFESDDIKLYLRYQKYYIEIDGQLINISKFQTPKKIKLPANLKQRWKEALGNSKSLSFKKVKDLLITYYKENELKYSTFFDSKRLKTEFEVGLSMSQNRGILLIPQQGEMKLNSISPAFYSNVRFYFPRFFEKSYLSGGIILERFSFQKSENVSDLAIYELNLKFYQLSFPLSANFRLNKYKGFYFYVKVGAKAYFNFLDNEQLISERLSNNVIRTNESKVKLTNNFGISPLIGFVVDKRIADREMSFSLICEKYMESESTPHSVAAFEMNKASVRFSVSLKF